MSQPGKNPITRVNATDKPIATPRSAGTRTASRASSPASGSVTHMLIMMRRYRNAAMTADTMAMSAMA